MTKVALITGTSSGLGAQLAIALAAGGYKTYASMRNPAKKGFLLDAAAQRGVSVEVTQLDVTVTPSVERCVSEILSQEGRLDLLINNAGAGFVRTTEQATEQEIQWVLDLNLMGVIRCTKAVIPHMRERRSGHVVNISSVGGLVGQPFNEIYCAAKFGVEGFTEAMASYLQPRFGIRFTVVEPGGIRSQFAASALAKFQESGGILDDEYKPILEDYLGSAGREIDRLYQTPEEIAQIVTEAIESEDPPIRVRTSPWAEDFSRLKTEADPTGKLQQQRVIGTFLTRG